MLSFIREYIMKNNRKYGFHTKVIHQAQSPENWEGATHAPIFQTASHLHPTAENLSQTFAGKKMIIFICALPILQIVPLRKN